MADVLIALGGNVGDVRATFKKAIANICGMTQAALLARAQDVELRLGRDRAQEKRNGPRTCDIDILAYDDLTLNEPNLVLPHPRLFERAFVLVPLAEIAPDRIIAGRRVADALAQLSTEGIQRLPDLD